MANIWEKIENVKETGERWANTYRMKVPGGWVVRTSEMHVPGSATGAGVVTATAMTFVPDMDHSWRAQ